VLSMEDKLKCKECGQEFSKIDCVTRHAKMVHKMEPKAYYDKWFKTADEGKCKCCGTETKYWNLEHGYREFCSRRCFWKVTTQLDSVKEKREQTCNKKYGSKNYMQSQDFKEKSEQTNFKEYGVKNAGGSVESIKKIKATKLANHGSETYNNMEQTYATKELKYGDKYYNNKMQSRKTWNAKYNIDITSPMQIPGVKQKALSYRSKMTTPEKKVYEFLKNRKFVFEYGYELNGKSFDFAVFNDNELKLLIKIDGIYYHGLSEDSNGKHVRGENDCERFSKVPENVKYIVCDDTNIEKCFDEITKVYDMDYEEWVKSIISDLPKEFPYPKYSIERIEKDWKHLQEWKWNKNSYVGSSIIRNFHESIWEARVGNNISPVECWSNKELLEKTVRNRMIYSSRLSSQCIVDGFNVSKIAPKVSVFNPMLAKHLIETYMKFDSDKQVFDPFSGFSGRMLGTCSLGIKYIGQDINQKHVDESNKIIKALNLDATVTCKNIFDSHGVYYSLFTCPPYNLKEIWNDKEINMSCDDWIDLCMKNFDCHEYLFIADKTEKYKDFIVETVDNKSHFSNNKEYVLYISK